VCLKVEPATVGVDHGVSLAAIDFLAWIAAADNDGRPSSMFTPRVVKLRSVT
jgi:hypothetical protein